MDACKYDGSMLSQFMLAVCRKVPKVHLELMVALILRDGATVATGCSGVETVWYVTVALASALFAQGLSCPPIKHVFAVEFDPLKADMIMSCTDVKLVFTNIMHMDQEMAKTWSGGCFQLILSASIFVAGFSCKNMSWLNIRRKTSDSYIRDCLGSTG